MDSLNSSVATIRLNLSSGSLDEEQSPQAAAPDHAPLMKVMAGDSSQYVEAERYDPQSHASFEKMHSFLDDRFGGYQNFGLKFPKDDGENLVLFSRKDATITAFFTNCNGSTVGQPFTLHNFDPLKAALDEHVAALSPQGKAPAVLLATEEFEALPDVVLPPEWTADAHAQQGQVDKLSSIEPKMEAAGRKIAAAFKADTERRLNDAGVGFREYLVSIDAKLVVDPASLSEGDAVVVSRADAIKWDNHAWFGVLGAKPSAENKKFIFSDLIDLNGIPLTTANDRKNLASMPDINPENPGRDLEHLMDAEISKAKLEYLASSKALYKLPAHLDRSALLNASGVVAAKIEQGLEKFLGRRNNCNHVALRIIKQAQSVHLAQKRAAQIGP